MHEGAMLLLLSLDGAGYLLAVGNVATRQSDMVAVLEDIFVAVAHPHGRTGPPRHDRARHR
jgi:hypothetical protein